MARIMNLGSETDIKWIYNVTFPVGPAGSNRKDDVLLVQHAINTLLPHFEIRDPKGVRITIYLKRDGIVGPRTAEAILGYQKNLRTRNRMVTADGQVDPANPTGWTIHTKDQYTIVHLNRDHRNVYGQMMREEDFPKELQAVLKATKIV